MEKVPAFSHEDFKVLAVEKGGSGRKFYRLHAGERSMILVKYTGQREENLHYVDIARFLSAAGVQVPHVYFHDAAEGLIWMQDLGGEDLWASRGAPWVERRPLYESALIEGFKIHTAATRRQHEFEVTVQKEFNEALYLWEQGYFFEHCLGNFFKVPASDVIRLAGLPALGQTARRLASLPRVLVHRDFQSQNVMICGGTAWLIDFQGMRPGLAAYDVASLLYDPYVTLTAAERQEMLEFYIRLSRRSGVDLPEDFEEIYLWCAAQRLMQALGAYGFLGLQKGRADFLHHVPAARASLREVVSRLDGLGDLVNLLDSLP